LLPENSLQPREYQQRIAEVASSNNTLVVLPTGLGKTMIAVLTAKLRLEKSEGGKVVMLAPTRPLVLQHYNTFKSTLALQDTEISIMTGETDPEERSHLWRRSRFIFATPQTVRNDVRSGRVELTDVILLIFDEAHRSVKDYSYAQLAKLYKEQARTPLIMGLTASPGGSREKVNEITRNLYIERVEARTEDDEDVRPYVEQTRLEGVKVSLPKEYSILLRAIREVYNEKITRLIEAGFLPKTRLSKSMLLASRGVMVSRLKASSAVGKGYLYGALISQAQAVIVLHAIELLETQGITVLLMYLSRLRERPEQGRSATALLKDPRWRFIEEEAARIRNVGYPKLDKVAEIVKQQVQSKADCKIIVFTQYRDTIETIIERLAGVGVNSARFVGQANKVDNEGMDQKQQTEALKKFSAGDFSVLVSSSIGEEGLHVPDVDLVVFYEAVPSEIRSIQRKGRTGRTRPGRVIILLAEGTVDESYYFSSIRKEKLMKSLISGGMEKQELAIEEPKSAEPVTLLDYMQEESGD
jgi:Fanconi anemia group M protein